MRHLHVVEFVAVLIVPAAVFGHYFRYGWDQCHPARTRVTADQRALAARSLPGMTDVSFQGSDVTLRGWYAPPRNGRVVIFTHGLGGNRASLLPEAIAIARHGYGVLLYDCRDSGESSGDAATWGYREADDVKDAVTYALSRPGVDRVAILGHSVGASAVARAGAEDPRVGATILYATWTSLRDENAYKTQRRGFVARIPALLGYRASGVDVNAIHPIDDVSLIAPRPLLLVEGLSDTDTPPWVMDRIYAAAKPPKERFVVPGAEHGECFEKAPAEYEARVVAFLDRALGTAASVTVTDRGR